MSSPSIMANIPEAIQLRRNKIEPKCIAYRKTFAEHVERYGDWNSYVEALDGHDKKLASAIKKVAGSLSDDYRGTPSGLDSFIRDMELNTLYHVGRDLDRRAGKDSDKAFQMSRAIAEYHLNESLEAEKQATSTHLDREPLDEPSTLQPQDGDAISVDFEREASDGTGAPRPPTDGSSLCPPQSASTGTTGVLSRVLSIFTGSK
jgi:hypothetical protein